MNNGPIAVSAPGVSLRTATGTQVTFNTRYPFHKLDSTNTNSFQIVTLFFNTEPPSPDGTISFYQRTLIYKFAHGYSYIPSTWFLVSTNNFTSALGPEGVFLVGSPNTLFGSAALIVTVDATNVNFYIDKYWDSSLGGSAPSVLGLFVAIRSYVFVNDVSGSDVPSQA